MSLVLIKCAAKREPKENQTKLLLQDRQAIDGFVYREHGTRPKDLPNGDVDDLWRLSIQTNGKDIGT